MELDETMARQISKLTELEQRLLAFIFQGAGNRVSFEKIKSYHIKEASSTSSFWKYWKDQIPYQMVKSGLIDKESYYLEKYLESELMILGGVIVYVLFLGADSDIGSLYKGNIQFVLGFTGALAIAVIILRVFKSFIYRRSMLG